MSDTRHFRRFPGFEQNTLCFLWVECNIVRLAIFSSTSPVFGRDTSTVFQKHCFHNPEKINVQSQWCASSLESQVAQEDVETAKTVVREACNHLEKYVGTTQQGMQCQLEASRVTELGHQVSQSIEKAKHLVSQSYLPLQRGTWKHYPYET